MTKAREERPDEQLPSLKALIEELDRCRAVLNESLADVHTRIVDVGIAVRAEAMTIARLAGEPRHTLTRLLIVNILVQGPYSIVPTLWQHAGSQGVEELYRRGLACLRREVEAVVRATPLNQPWRCPVILDPWLASQFIHECIGHTSEADNFLRYAQPAGLDLGDRWCDFPLKVVDDPTLDGHVGSYSYDDEGEPARRVELVTDGLWSDLLFDRTHSFILGRAASGSARRTAYAAHALPRMSVLVTAPGSRDLNALLGSIEHGILCTGTWGGLSSGLNFTIRPAFGEIIRDGERTGELIRRFDVFGDKREALAAIASASTDLEWFHPVFGCDKEGQNQLRVTFAAPHLLLSSAQTRPLPHAQRRRRGVRR